MPSYVLNKMATIHNSDVMKNAADHAGIQQLSGDRIPSQLGDVVIPVMEVNPHLVKEGIYKSYNGNSASQTLYTTSSKNDFFLTGMAISGSAIGSDVENNILLTFTTADGTTQKFSSNSISTVAGYPTSNSLSFGITHPIRLAKNSTIILSADLGGITHFGMISGFEVRETQ
jgi:hypothetical protein